MNVTEQLKKLCAEQRLKNWKRNAQVLTILKYGKRKKKTTGKYYEKTTKKINMLKLHFGIRQ